MLQRTTFLVSAPSPSTHPATVRAPQPWQKSRPSAAEAPATASRSAEGGSRNGMIMGISGYNGWQLTIVIWMKKTWNTILSYNFVSGYIPFRLTGIVPHSAAIVVIMLVVNDDITTHDIPVIIVLTTLVIWMIMILATIVSQWLMVTLTLLVDY